MGKDVVAYNEISFSPVGDELPCCLKAKELTEGIYSCVTGHFSNILSRLDPETWNPVADKVLEKVAIVAGNLSDEALTVQPKPFGEY